MFARLLAEAREIILTSGDLHHPQLDVCAALSEGYNQDLSSEICSRLKDHLSWTPGMYISGRNVATSQSAIGLCLDIAQFDAVLQTAASSHLIRLLFMNKKAGLWGFEACTELKCDPRQLHSISAPLDELGIIKKITISLPERIRKMFMTSASSSQLMFLRKFLFVDEIGEDLASQVRAQLELEDPICELLFDCVKTYAHKHSESLLESTAREILIKNPSFLARSADLESRDLFKTIRDKLIDSGRLSSVYLSDGDQATSRRGLALSNQNSALSDAEELDAQESTTHELLGLPAESTSVPLLGAIYIFLVASGSFGCNLNDIIYAFRFSRKHLEKYLDALLKIYPVVKVADNGRAHRWSASMKPDKFPRQKALGLSSQRRLAFICDYLRERNQASLSDLCRDLAEHEINFGWSPKGSSIDRKTLIKLINSAAGPIRIQDRSELFPDTQKMFVVYDSYSVSSIQACSLVDRNSGLGGSNNCVSKTIRKVHLQSIKFKQSSSSESPRHPSRPSDGYIEAPMQRLKILHLHLIDRFPKKNFTMNDLINEISLTVFLHVVGSWRPNMFLDRLEQDQSDQLRISQLPPDVRGHLLIGNCQKKSAGKSLRSMLASLIRIRAVQYSEYNKKYILSDSIHLARFSDDIMGANSTLYSLETSHTAHHFWRDYEIFSRGWRSEFGKKLPRNLLGNLVEALRSKAWGSGSSLSSAQSKSLEVFYRDFALSARYAENQLVLDCNYRPLQRICSDLEIDIGKALEFLSNFAKSLKAEEAALVFVAPRKSSKFRCHVCGEYASLLRRIENHYRSSHDRALPEDLSQFVLPSFIPLLGRPSTPQGPTRRKYRKWLLLNRRDDSLSETARYLKYHCAARYLSPNKSSSQFWKCFCIVSGDYSLREAKNRLEKSLSNDRLVSTSLRVTTPDRPSKRLHESNSVQVIKRGSEGNSLVMALGRSALLNETDLSDLPLNFLNWRQKIIDLFISWNQQGLCVKNGLDVWAPSTVLRSTMQRAESSKRVIHLSRSISEEPDDPRVVITLLEASAVSDIELSIREMHSSTAVDYTGEEGLNGVAIHLQSTSKLKMGSLTVIPASPNRCSPTYTEPDFSMRELDKDNPAEYLWWYFTGESRIDSQEILAWMLNTIIGSGPSGISSEAFKHRFVARYPAELEQVWFDALDVFETLRVSVSVCSSTGEIFFPLEHSSQLFIQRSPSIPSSSHTIPGARLNVLHVLFDPEIIPIKVRNCVHSVRRLLSIGASMMLRDNQVQILSWVTFQGTVNHELLNGLYNLILASINERPGLSLSQFLNNFSIVGETEIKLLIRAAIRSGSIVVESGRIFRTSY